MEGNGVSDEEEVTSLAQHRTDRGRGLVLRDKAAWTTVVGEKVEAYCFAVGSWLELETLKYDRTRT